MCGIAGIFDPNAQSGHQHLVALTRAMIQSLHHRGPDGDGVWADQEQGVALGHRRLSIIDLSSTGAQPMASPSGRFMLTYNGMIYNYLELRRELKQSGVRFRGSSDTEVLAGALDTWGLDKTLQRLNGMFAFAVWDRQRRSLSLARDRFGEKPLYWGWRQGLLIFGSELRSLRAVTRRLDLDVDAVADVLAHKAVQGSRTIFEQFHKLPPGHVAVADATGDPKITCYWSAMEVALKAVTDPLVVDERAASEELACRLEDIVASRMVADVPVGVFLSGGVDSAGIAAFMMRAASEPVKSFTVGLDDPRFDESQQAQVVADRLGTVHRPLRVTANEALHLMPKLPSVYDEPFADSSQLPTLLVSTLAATEIKVALSGDGGDEIFGGYNRHVQGERLLAAHRALPQSLRRRLGLALANADPTQIERHFQRIAPLLPERLRVRLPADKARKLGRTMQATSAMGAYQALITDIDPYLLLHGEERDRDSSVHWWSGDEISFSESIMLADTLSYLPNDVLAKVDRAAMSVSLETRAPYLDHELYEWAWRLPSFLRASKGLGKRVLRRVVTDQLDGFDISHVKSGFGIPVGEWLRGPLRPWAEDLLPKGDDSSGLFLAAPIQRLWSEHMQGVADHTDVLWSVLSLRAWLDDTTSQPLKAMT